MTIVKKELISVLEKCLPGIGVGTSVVEGADTFVFSKGSVFSYNSAIAVRVQLPEGCVLEGIVKALDFYNAVSKLPSETFEMTCEKEQWRMVDGKIKINMKLLDLPKIYERFSDIAPDENKWIDVDGENFQKELKISFIDKNTSQYAGIVFHDGKMLSTNAWIICSLNMKSQNFPNSWITSDACLELAKWTFTKVQLNKTWLLFKTDNVVFCVKTLFGDGFPTATLGTVLDNAKAETSMLSIDMNKELIDAITRASVLSESVDGYDAIEFSFSKNGLRILSKRTSGDYDELIDSVKSDTEVSIKIDIKSLLDCANYYKSFKILAKSDSKPARLLFIADDYTRLISSVA